MRVVRHKFDLILILNFLQFIFMYGNFHHRNCHVKRSLCYKLVKCFCFPPAVLAPPLHPINFL